MAVFDLADWIYPDAAMRRQPQGPVEIDYENPITKDLVGIVTPHSPLTMFAAITDLQRMNTANGIGFAFPAQTTSGAIGVSTSGVFGTRSLFYCGRVPSYSGAIAGFHNAQVSRFLSNGAGQIQCNQTGSWGTIASAFYTPDRDVFTGIIESQNGQSSKLYIDAVLKESPATAGYSVTSTDRIILGGQGVSGGYIAGEGALIVAGFNRFLTQKEKESLRDNPWQLVRPTARSIFYSLPAAGAGSTLNAAATGNANATGTANLAAQVALAAIGLATASGNAAAAVDVPLSAAGLAIADGTANPTATISISAAGLATAAGQAGLSADVLIAAAGAAQAAGNADLAATLEAMATGAAQAGGTANLTGGAAGDLNAAGQAQANGNAALTVTIQLAALGAAQSTGGATGQLLTSGQIAAAGQALASGSAMPTITVAIAADGQSQSTGSATASLSSSGQITAFGQSQAAGNAELTVTAIITAAGFVQAMGAGALAIEIPLAAFGQSLAGGSASLTEVPDYIPIPPLRLVATAQRQANLQIGSQRQTILRHEVIRAS